MAESTEQDSDDEDPLHSWSQFAQSLAIEESSEENEKLGTSQMLEYKHLTFRKNVYEANHLLKAGGDKHRGFLVDLPLLMDPTYKYRLACPAFIKLPKNLYTFLTNMYPDYLKMVNVHSRP